MPYLYILDCSGDIDTCCADFGLANILGAIQRILNIIHIIVPIILIVGLIIQFTQMVVNPEDEQNKKSKSLINKVMATVVVFLLPTIVNVVVNLVFSEFSFASCWHSAEISEEMTLAMENTFVSTTDKKPKSFIVMPEDYDDPEVTAKPENGSGGDGTILLIAGHSYPPYCASSPNDCRGMISSGYDETDQTRILVKLIQSELSSLGVSSDIATALMAGNSNDMNTSFYRECRNNTSLCHQFDWGKYKYVLEIHFNASGSGRAAGTQLVKRTSSYSTAADQAIVNAVISNTGHRQFSDYIYSAFDIGYFMNLGVPITYLETEFYDNKQAMDTYNSKKEQIAKDIAKAIQQYYG